MPYQSTASSHRTMSVVMQETTQPMWSVSLPAYRDTQCALYGKLILLWYAVQLDTRAAHFSRKPCRWPLI